MGRKASVFIIIILVSGLAVILYFLQKNNKNAVTDPYLFIPGDACFFIESTDFPGLLNSFTQDNGLYGELEKVKQLELFAAKVKYFRDFVSLNQISGFFENNRSVISFHPTDEKGVSALFSMSIPEGAGYKNVIRAVRSSIAGKIDERNYNGMKLYGIPYKIGNQADTVFIIFRSGLVLASDSRVLLQRSVNGSQILSGLKSLPGITRIMGAAGRNEDKIFIVFRNFAEIIRKISDKKSPDLYRSFSNLAAATEGDIYINEGGIVLSGYAESTDSAQSISKFKTQKASELNTSEVLPSTVVQFITCLIYYNNNSLPENSLTDDATKDLAAKLLPFTGDEISRALLSTKDENLSFISLIELKNRSAAEQIIITKISEWADMKKLRESDFIEIYQPDDQTKIPVYKTPFRNLASAFIPGIGKASDDSLLAFIDNFLITGSSYASVTKVLYDNILNKTLANDPAYRDFEKTLPSRTGYYFYCVPSQVIDYLSLWLNDDIIAGLNSNMDRLQKIPAIGFQFAASNKMIYNTLSVKFGEAVREESGAEWETLLDAVASIKPFFFTNHNTGAKEIFIQDVENNAYLINSAGRVLWKIKLSERIFGQVFMIDYYGNGKNQILFAGRNYLHLLDRNGNYVERYPVRLRSPASAPPALFDYDGNNEYRILVPGEDRFIYAYDKSGNVVKGWKPFSTNGLVKSPLKFFRVSGKDYLVASDNTTVYFLDRTGNIRLKLKSPVVKAEGSEIRLYNGRDPYIVFSSPEGAVQTVTFDGNTDKFDLRKFSGDHMFEFFDIDGDGFGEYFFIDHGILYLYDNDKTLVFEKDFGSDDLEGPISFTFSASDRKIGVLDRTRKQIYLIDKNGNTMSGFPLRGASVFSIGKLSDETGFHLIVGGDDNFLYNYKLNTESK